jgi:hypothetical protein
MARLPTVIASSVIRSTHQGESHGGVYLVDLEKGAFKQVIDWNLAAIDWRGRGADRGLRGIAFYQGNVYLAASDEVFVYNRHFNRLESFRNRYLKHCHEIFIHGDTLFLTSTGFDSILEFDLRRQQFVRGWCVRHGPILRRLAKLRMRVAPRCAPFDPNSDQGPAPGDTIHLNNVFVADGTVYFAGTGLGFLLALAKGRVTPYARLPFGTHNARPFREGVLFNHTASHRIVYADRNGRVHESFPIKQYPEDELLMSHLPKDHAVQAFGRGLCTTDEGLLIGGSSPATISAYCLGEREAVKTVNMTMDVRNAIHGLEIWPFPVE